MRKILALYVVAAVAFATVGVASRADANTKTAACIGAADWHGWLTAPDGKVAGNYSPGNENAAACGSWAAWDKSSNGLCAEIWVAPSATGSFQRVPGTKACGFNVVRIVGNDPVPLSYVYRARVVETLPTCPPLPRSCWADSGYEFFRIGYDPD